MSCFKIIVKLITSDITPLYLLLYLLLWALQWCTGSTFCYIKVLFVELYHLGVTLVKAYQIGCIVSINGIPLALFSCGNLYHVSFCSNSTVMQFYYPPCKMVPSIIVLGRLHSCIVGLVFIKDTVYVILFGFIIPSDLS